MWRALPACLLFVFPMTFESATPADPRVAALCREVVAIVSTTPGTLVSAIDGGVYDHIAGRDRHGCLILVAGTWTALRQQQNPIDRVADTLMARGWTQGTDYGADGSDGTMLGLEKDGLFCLMEGRWDGGDESDSTVVPLDLYQMTILCTTLTESAGAPATAK
jgi:hypothetical protein